MNILYALLTLLPVAPPADSLAVHELSPVVVSSAIKHSGAFAREPVTVSSFTGDRIAKNRITDTKSLSLHIPNFIQADYGSRMTSSLYMRGIGARMEQPAVGLYVDNIPILNKNNYDLDYYDIDRIHVLRGPQGTLYGRNTIGGLIDIHSLSPQHFQGTKIHAGYGNGNTSEFKVSVYRKPTDRFAFSAAFSHLYSDGFFTNEYDGSQADRIMSENARFRAIFTLSPRWTLENTLMANYVRQRGFAYSLYDEQTGTASPVDHNDPCSYERLNVMDGLTFRYNGERFRFSSTTSGQFTRDDMLLDQDFRPASVFTLRQTQRELAATQEFVLRSHVDARWEWITGAFGFWKHNKMEAPVTFKRDGIDQLILANANRGIHMMFPDADLEIKEDAFTIASGFRLPVWGASLYHQSSRRTGRWKLTAGLRADYEHTAIRYENSTAIRYRFTLTMPDFKPLPVQLDGNQGKSFLELMPHLSAAYDTGAGIVYASVSRGYKSGGFNTQIFSDILQNKMMGDLMADLGLHMGGAETDVAWTISYKPEYSWNYEAGAHLAWFDRRLGLDAAVFYIDMRDQQLTVFPLGQTTGRMMSNAGHSRNFGAETSLSFRSGRFLAAGTYGYTNARFIDYVSGNTDYSGKTAPYVPRHTASAQVEYRQPVAGRWADDVTFNVSWHGMGPLYWNEDNTLRQPFYGLLNAYITWRRGGLAVSLWGSNLAGTDYNTFYFRSVGNSFVQRGKPLRFGLSINIKI